MVQVVPKEIQTFGELVRWCRSQRGWSVRELARRLNMSAPFISDVERDHRMLTDYKPVSELFDISLRDIYIRLRHVDTAAKDFLNTHPDVLLQVQKARAKCECELCKPT